MAPCQERCAGAVVRKERGRSVVVLLKEVGRSVMFVFESVETSGVKVLSNSEVVLEVVLVVLLVSSARLKRDAACNVREFEGTGSLLRVLLSFRVLLFLLLLLLLLLLFFFFDLEDRNDSASELSPAVELSSSSLRRRRSGVFVFLACLRLFCLRA